MNGLRGVWLVMMFLAAAVVGLAVWVNTQVHSKASQDSFVELRKEAGASIDDYRERISKLEAEVEGHLAGQTGHPEGIERDGVQNERITSLEGSLGRAHEEINTLRDLIRDTMLPMLKNEP